MILKCCKINFCVCTTVSLSKSCCHRSSIIKSKKTASSVMVVVQMFVENFAISVELYIGFFINFLPFKGFGICKSLGKFWNLSLTL